ncbi:MAG: phytanoyl-CoA dioxygenase family protein [Magnetospirillum sp.]|nr:phytanoyl-CoA dioxygenase family protein [Magnetospirillum sp.]
MSHLPTFADSADQGRLGLVWLKRLWSQWVVGHGARADAVAAWRATKVLLSGLNLGVEEVMRWCGSRASFEEFEDWVLECNGGAIDPLTVTRINAALTGAPPPPAIRERLDAIERLPDVLGPAELGQWHEQGWVVLPNAIDAAACAAAAQVVWDAQGMSPERPEEWGRFGPRQQCVFVQLFRHPALRVARESPRVHKAFAQLWGTADLWMTTDRVGFNPPERSGLQFQGPGIHWDVSLVQPIPLGIQGLLYLSDTTAEQGAFALVPGMHRTIGDWLDSVPSGEHPQHFAARTLTMTPIAGKAGDLVIWHHALPHGPTPNRSDQPRLVQYLKMFPADFGYQPEWL